MQNSKLLFAKQTRRLRLQVKTQNLKHFKKTLHFALCTLNSWPGQAGQALVTLLVFVVISIIITSAAVIIIAINTRAAFELEQGTLAYYIAESGAENALLRLLRDPFYTGEVLTVGNGTATILVTGTDPKTITSTGKVGNFSRRVQVLAGYTNNILTVNSWKEVP